VRAIVPQETDRRQSNQPSKSKSTVSRAADAAAAIRGLRVALNQHENFPRPGDGAPR
jgi:hypothetical protein